MVYSDDNDIIIFYFIILNYFAYHCNCVCVGYKVVG